MKRIKQLSLAAIAVLALTAFVGLGSASADSFVASSYPVTVTGKALGAGSAISSNGTSITCEKENDFSDSVWRPTAALKGWGMSPSGCKKSYPEAGTPISIEMKGCQFIFRPGAVPKGTFDIGPAGCGPIKLIEGTTCTKLIGSQKGMPATYNNNIAGVEIKISATMSYTVEKSTVNCKPGTLVYQASWQVTGNGGVAIKTVPPVGVYLTGEASESEAKQPRFEVENYPTFVEGNQSAADKHVLSIAGRTFECDEVAWDSSSNGAVKGPTSTLAFGGNYEGCTANILGNQKPAMVDMNSCSYGLNALNSGPPYAGSLDIFCTSGGDGIEFLAYNTQADLEANKPLCNYKLAPQSNLGGIGLANSGTGQDRQVSVDLGLSEVAYTRTVGAFLTCWYASGNASYSGTSTLHGLD